MACHCWPVASVMTAFLPVSAGSAEVRPVVAYGGSLIPVPSICRIRLLCLFNALTGDVDRKKLKRRVDTEQPTQIVDEGYAKIASPVMPYPLFLNSRRDWVHRQVPDDHYEAPDYTPPPHFFTT